MSKTAKRATAWPVPDDVQESMRAIKAASGRSIVWLIAAALRFALRPEQRRLWLDEGV